VPDVVIGPPVNVNPVVPPEPLIDVTVPPPPPPPPVIQPPAVEVAKHVEMMPPANVLVAVLVACTEPNTPRVAARFVPVVKVVVADELEK
jgi:hypothetical protein